MQGWVPDENVCEAVIAGRMRFADLPDVERRWVVAQLTVRGYSAARIADWLGVSPRHVKRLRAESMTRVMVSMIGERDRAERLEADAAKLRDEVRQLRGELLPVAGVPFRHYGIIGTGEGVDRAQLTLELG